MNVAARSYISLFSGAGGLDLAVRLALPDAQCLCYVENEIAAARILAARIEEGSIDDAPIWSDVRTFPSATFRGRVAGIIGGFPCTDLSVAGRQAGITGEKSGLWFDYARIIREVQPGWVFIENVPPVIHVGNGGAVLGELAAMGFDAEWGTLSAAAVGASHLRKRVFILAYRAGRGPRELRESSRGDGLVDGGGEDVADAAICGCELRPGRRGLRREASNEVGIPNSGLQCEDVGDAERTERWPRDDRRGRGEPRRHSEGQAAGGLGESSEILGDAAIERCEKPGSGGERQLQTEAGSRVDHRSWQPSGELAHSGKPGLPHAECGAGRDLARHGQGAAATEFCRSLGLFAPGPADRRWQELLVRYPWLRPAISSAEAESHFRGMADGLAALVGGARADALRAVGNGVVAIQGTAMFRELLRRAR